MNDKTAADREVEVTRIDALDRIASRGQVWDRVAAKHGVTNPTPPWKSSLDGMCDAFDADGAILPLAQRRHDEDVLSESVYLDTPFPERQLLALAHSLIARGVIEEDALVRQMSAVRARLESA